MADKLPLTAPRADEIGFASGGSRDPRHAAAILVSAAIIIAALYYGRDVLIPLACAFLISFALHPPVTWLERLGLPRIAAVIAVVTMVLALLAGLVVVLGSQVRSLSEELPTYESTIRTKVSKIRAQLRAPGILDRAMETVQPPEQEPAPETGADAQKVEIVPDRQEPIETAIDWLVPSLQPLAMAGIVFVFVILALLDRRDLRDRLLRLLGGNLHRSTDALEEAGTRISKYLLMQVIVNVSYGVPMAIGLWLIGVPAAPLWGALAAIMRFVPYVGPLISAVFPIGLAFAVDPGWSMVLWTIALIVSLEVISNNIVEPLLYGASTGLSAMSLIAAATFWTTLWGPAGLILSTPLTVCLLVIGKNIPQLRFLDTLLGSMPPLDIQTRIYQRLIAGDADEAIDIANAFIEQGSVRQFYNDVGIAMLRLASEDYHRQATAEHRLRVSNGMEELLDDLREEFPASGDLSTRQVGRVVCIGGKWEIDTLAAEMLAHALEMEGIPSAVHAASTLGGNKLSTLDLKPGDIVCLSYFSSNPAVAMRQLCRRLRRRWPQVEIVLAPWNLPETVGEVEVFKEMGVSDVFASVDEAVQKLVLAMAPDESKAVNAVERPENDDERVEALRSTGVLAGDSREELDAIAIRAADVLNVGFAVISVIDEDREFIVGQSKFLPGVQTDDGTNMVVIPRDDAVCDHVVASNDRIVIPDVARDPRFAENPVLKNWNARFYAGVPLRSAEGFVLGAMCILDSKPRALDEQELTVLSKIAADVVQEITGDDAGEEAEQPDDVASATVGQQVPE